jgi:Sodium:dicarboxylate symporter family
VPPPRKASCLKLPAYGASKQTVGLVLRTGYAFNPDGTPLFMSLCVVFLANAYKVPLSWQQSLGILGIMLLTSKGAATVSGGTFVVFAATVTATGILPIGGLARIFGAAFSCRSRSPRAMSSSTPSLRSSLPSSPASSIRRVTRLRVETCPTIRQSLADSALQRRATKRLAQMRKAEILSQISPRAIASCAARFSPAQDVLEFYRLINSQTPKFVSRNVQNKTTRPSGCIRE